MELLLLDVFADGPCGGSVAAVVPDGWGLTGQQMQQIAREVCVPRTVFASELQEDRVHLRFFSPVAEVGCSACATIAALVLQFSRGQVRVGNEPVRIQVGTREGDLMAELFPHPAQGVEIELTLVPPRFAPFRYNLDLLAGVLGTQRAQIPDTWPLGLASVGAWTLVVPLLSGKAIDDARPDVEALAQLGQKIGAERSLLYTWKGPAELACRGFAPLLGGVEEATSALGSAAAASLLVREGALPLTPPATRIVAVQGARLGRAGRVSIEVGHTERSVRSVKVRGTAQVTLEGAIRLPT